MSIEHKEKDDFYITLVEGLNGHHYIGSQEGETLESVSDTIVYIPHAMKVASVPLEKNEYNGREVSYFVRVNAHHLMKVEANGAKIYDERTAIMIAFYRFLSVRFGLSSYVFDHTTFHADYNDATKFDTTSFEPTVTNDAVRAVLTKSFVEVAMRTFTDKVCLLAYVFRVRGHHYTEHLEELYASIWEKCRYKDAEKHLSWKNLNRVALHSILPEVLDAFYTFAVKNNLANGALIKRYDSAPAGCAGPYVLSQGIQDLEMVAPGIKERLGKAADELAAIIKKLEEHRFNGSVNARYYGAERVVVREKTLGAVAATILAALESLASDAPLAQSNALKRIASNAPITGAVLGRAIAKISDRPEVTDALMITK